MFSIEDHLKNDLLIYGVYFVHLCYYVDDKHYLLFLKKFIVIIVFVQIIYCFRSLPVVLLVQTFCTPSTHHYLRYFIFFFSNFQTFFRKKLNFLCLLAVCKNNIKTEIYSSSLIRFKFYTQLLTVIIYLILCRLQDNSPRDNSPADNSPKNLNFFC